MFDTNNISLAGVLALLSCPGDHESRPVMDPKDGVAPVRVGSTSKYPRGFAMLFVLALRLPFYRNRQYIL